MEMFKEGITVGKMAEILKLLPPDKPFYVCSDEEQNQTFKGIYIEVYENSVVVAGLSGLEVDEE